MDIQSLIEILNICIAYFIFSTETMNLIDCDVRNNF